MDLAAARRAYADELSRIERECAEAYREDLAARKSGMDSTARLAFLLLTLGRLLGYAWLVPVWCFLAVRTGWRDVHPKVSDGRAGTR